MSVTCPCRFIVRRDINKEAAPVMDLSDSSNGESLKTIGPINAPGPNAVPSARCKWA